ncbi:hypothetical protein V5799_018613 [Amblyomma americanum]|uniref:Secreted protein n=1 Tax=Amblyomma americanum TaxID=6943 RepID=A0AAQ4EYR9_AMBAM
METKNVPVVLIALLVLAMQASVVFDAVVSTKTSNIGLKEFYSGPVPIWIYCATGPNADPCKYDIDILKYGDDTFFLRYAKEERGWRVNQVTARHSDEPDTFTVFYDDGEIHIERLVVASESGKCALFEVLVRARGVSKNPNKKARRLESRSYFYIDLRVKKYNAHTHNFNEDCLNSVVR